MLAPIRETEMPNAEQQPPTVTEVVASVKMPNALRTAEDSFQTARAQRHDLQEQMRALIAAGSSPGGSMVYDREITQLSNEIAALGEVIDDARAARAPHRAKYGAAVQAALNPVRMKAAQRMLTALGEIAEAQAVLNESREEIAKAGGAAAEVPPVFFERAVDVVRRIASGTSTPVAAGPLDFESMRVK